MKIVIFSRQQLLDIINKYDLSIKKLELEHIYVLSIRSFDRDNVITSDCNNWLNLQFDDITDIDIEKHDLKLDKLTLFNSNHCKQIFDFIPDNFKTIIVQCDAGISRSGAVGTFLNDWYKLDYKTFKQNNSHILPNIYVLNTLNKYARDNF